MRSNPNPFRVLIACLLSLRARDENTAKVSKDLFKVAKTPNQILATPMKRLERIIYSSGHYKKKDRVLKHVSKEILKRFNGKVPKTRDELMSIKGIVPKTSNIVLSFAFNQCVIPVDTHVHVIANRLGWVKTKTAEKTEPELMKVIPRKYCADLNSVLVQFGREVCITVSPKCSICPVKRYCQRIGVIKSR
jgi:endonuclease-3